MKNKTKSTYIEVNGKRYDAITGKVLGATDKAKPATVGTSMDGVSRKKPDTQRQPAVNHAKKVQKSKTLMRTAVKKPAADKRASQAHERPGARSPLISKFGDNYKPVEARIEPVMVAHAKEEVNLVHKQINLKANTSSTSQAENMINRAMEKSTSHTQLRHKPAKKRSRVESKLGISRKTARLGSGFMAVLLLGAFFAYQNIPNFAMRVAATRAGFAAKMPDYHPSGFAYKGPVEYKSGEVTVKFGSNNGDDRQFILTQRASNWNNDALLANFVLSSDSQYQTFQENSKTIYIYDRSNATWVDQGVWYQLEGNAELTTDQISKLANSL